jgi:hypothetical protein
MYYERRKTGASSSIRADVPPANLVEKRPPPFKNAVTGVA